MIPPLRRRPSRSRRRSDFAQIPVSPSSPLASISNDGVIQKRSFMNIAFIGLGNMGSAMATNLLKAGHTLSVYNRSRARADALKSLGARVASTPGEAATGAEVAITMLADDHAVESVVFEKGNLLESLPPNAVH